MKIGIDGRSLAGRRTGIGRMLFELCKQFDQLLPEAQFFVYSKEPVVPPVVNERWFYRVDNRFWVRHLSSGMWLKWCCGQLCQQDGLNIFFATATLFPKLSPLVKKISVVHDLHFIFSPESMSPLMRLGFKKYFKRDVCAADIVITPSQGTADKLNHFCCCNKVKVIHHGLDRNFRPISMDEQQQVLAKLKINFPYLLFVGTCEPRKNLKLLLDAFIDIKSQGLLPNHKLVLVGDSGWKSKVVLKPLYEHADYFKRLGYVPDDALPALYAASDLVVLPSLYEGFGMPIAEALACGASMLASDMPETREAGLDYAKYILPTRENLFQAIVSIIENQPAKTSKEEVAANRVLPFSWDKAGKLYVEAIRQCIKTQ